MRRAAGGIEAQLAEVDPRQLGGAAADIHHQGRVAVAVEQGHAAGHRQASLFLRGDDAELQPGLGFDSGDEVRTVLGRAAGLGRDRPQRRRAAAADAVGADRQGRQRPVHGRAVEPAGVGEAVAQAHDAREGLQHPEPPRRRRSDQQPAIVGAKVKRGVGAGLRAPLRVAAPGLHRRRRRL